MVCFSLDSLLVNAIPARPLLLSTDFLFPLCDAGIVSFGGAYTTRPFIYIVTVTVGGWLSTQQFMSALAITSIMPTALVSYVSYVGYVGGGVWTAFAMTVSMFLAAHWA